MKNIHSDRILIIDFGSQYTQLIARRIREIGVFCEILPWDVQPSELAAYPAKGIILSGGPDSAQDDAASLNTKLLGKNLPILGICYGMQLLASQLGGQVEVSARREFGHATITLEESSQLLGGLVKDSQLDVWMSHGDSVSELPAGFALAGSSGSGSISAMEDSSRSLYAIQFHPEVTHTQCGLEILRRFACDLCDCEPLWTSSNIINESRAAIRKQVGDDIVLLGLSGGVDSSVVAALLHQAIGDQLMCVFVDTGLLRFGEADQVMAAFAANMGVTVEKVDACDRFFDALKGIDDPEAKRKVIGKLFVEIFEERAKVHKNARWLAQGTIYPDVIESAGSGTGKSHVIKSHHNVGGLPEHMEMQLLEPLRELFKDEVRKLGVALGLHKSMVYRHPFPGPGLGVRILGEVTREFAHLLARADHIFIEELRNFDWYDKVSQAFAVFLPVKSVGVVGDARCYDYVIALRAVETIDFMTASWARLPYELLAKVSNRIINEIDGISRVTYDISGKPPATIEWE